MMRIALIGAAGQLGTALTARLSGQVIPLGRESLDISDAGSVRETLPRARPSLVINAAAYNFVDRAEDESDRAIAVNALGPQYVAEACASLGVPLVHVSSDYVFGQDADRKTPYRESDPPGALSAYARSKLKGEELVQAACPNHYILRTCGLYGRAVSPGKGNFVETMLRLGRERGAVSVVDDQWCTPTAASDLAGWIAELVVTGKFGLYHATNSGSTTWCGLAREIFRCAGMTVDVKAITTAEFGAKARRPPFSVLDCAKLEGILGRRLRPWDEALADYLQSRRV
jgi:dTDP-4-dehydrorhamnose reductase